MSTTQRSIGAALLLIAVTAVADTPRDRFIAAARAQVGVTVSYNGAYQRIPYPNGDVPMHTGVCTDVVIRALRKVGVDLQRLVHEDMRANFSAYPKTWGLRRPDPNIDHRRVPNLGTFFRRRGLALPVTTRAADYQPGDIVTWHLTGTGVPHIGVVSNRRGSGGRHLVVHNIGAGTQEEDVLFAWKVTGHYRWVF